MALKIVGAVERGFCLDVKDFEVPGLRFSDTCPRCGEAWERPVGRSWFFPAVNSPLDVTARCAKCDHLWRAGSAAVRFSVELVPAEEERPKPPQAHVCAECGTLRGHEITEAQASASARCPGCDLERPTKLVPLEEVNGPWRVAPRGDCAFAPPFGTIRACLCGTLVAGGPTVCAFCAAGGGAVR